MSDKVFQINRRFQGYLPVVVDVETGGVNSAKDALLEIGAVFLAMDPTTGLIHPTDTFQTHIEPDTHLNIDNKALDVNGIQLGHPFRFAVEEPEAIEAFFAAVSTHVKAVGCRRAVLVGHNAHFDLHFIRAAAKRQNRINNTPFHAFTCFDTATLGALAFGKTVLAKALQAAKIPFNSDEAHSALYDAQKTAELFCQIVNTLT